MMPRSGHGIPRCSGAAGPGHEEEAVTEDRPAPSARALSGRTAWARNLQTPLRVFSRTETGSAAVLVAALVWINISASSYEAVWGARLSVQLAGAGVSLDLREWVNSGLMTFFFFVFGLEAARRDVRDCRNRPPGARDDHHPKRTHRQCDRSNHPGEAPGCARGLLRSAGHVSMAGLAELQQIIQLVEQSLDEPGLQVPPGWP
jgi:hypothetical protein